jgi:hypothetical protein
MSWVAVGQRKVGRWALQSRVVFSTMCPLACNVSGNTHQLEQPLGGTAPLPEPSDTSQSKLPRQAICELDVIQCINSANSPHVRKHPGGCSQCYSLLLGAIKCAPIYKARERSHQFICLGFVDNVMYCMDRTEGCIYTGLNPASARASSRCHGPVRCPAMQHIAQHSTCHAAHTTMPVCSIYTCCINLHNSYNDPCNYPSRSLWHAIVD